MCVGKRRKNRWRAGRMSRSTERAYISFWVRAAAAIKIFYSVRHTVEHQTSNRARGMSASFRTTTAALYLYVHGVSPHVYNVLRVRDKTTAQRGPSTPWGALISDNLRTKLEVGQNISLRTTYLAPRFVKYSVLLQSSGLKSIKQKIESASHNMFHKSTASHRTHLRTLGLTNATIDWKRLRTARLLVIIKSPNHYSEK
jgi:hypothetical protein